MPHGPPLIDVHCHLLPELDDGAATWDDALEMARLAAADHTATIIATPHQLGAYAGNTASTIRAATDRAQHLVQEHGLPLRIVPGAEVRVESDLLRRIRAGEVLTLADRGRHVLIELPHEVYFPLDRVISDLAASGVTPILAHPERNAGILAQPRVLGPLVRGGCLIQVTAGSLLGAFGPHIERLARSLLQQGLVHLIASDAHGARSRRPLLSRAFDAVQRLTGQEMAMQIFCRNPAAIVAGRTVASELPQTRPAPSPGWFRWKRAG